MPRLRITLLSQLCSGSGLDRPGVVDRDVVFDAWGIPYLPGRRLKGLLRDAYREVRQGLAAIEKLPEIKDVCGLPGQNKPGALEVRNAHLAKHGEIRTWLDGFLYEGEKHLDRRAEVMSSYCEIRKQTSIDRLTGAPKRDTLRATRTLRQGLVFEAEIGAGLSEEMIWAVALAAAALRQMGSSRNRGLGWVRCELWSAERNLTLEALGALSAEGFKGPSLKVGETVEASSPATVEENRADTEPSGPLLFEVELEDDAIFPALRGDPNTVFTEQYVPGTVIHGHFAKRYLDEGKAEDEFRRLFTSGQVRFEDARLAIDGERYSPTPHALRRLKRNGEPVDLTCGRAAPGLTRVGGHCVMDLLCGAGPRLRTAEIETELQYHHARAKDGRLQRAVGAEKAADFGLDAEKAGALFSYQAVRSGQRFRGQIDGPAELLGRLRGLISDGERIAIGRSKAAQYGGQARWRWLERPAETALSGTQEFTVVLESAMLSLNSMGHPAAEFPTEELAEALGGVQLTPKPPFVRTEWKGGYLSHQLLARQQMPALAAGSVFVFRAGAEISGETLQRAAQRAYGLRQEHGFGRIRILARGTLTAATVKELKRPAVAGDRAARGEALKLAEQLFREAVDQRVRREAEGDASSIDKHWPPKSLLFRLRGMLLAQTQKDFQNSIDTLRTPARIKVERCRIGKDRLAAVLGQDQKRIAEKFAEKEYESEKWRGVLTGGIPAVEARSGQLYLAELLAFTAKQAAKRGGGRT